MSEPHSQQWRDMANAPKDGTKVLVEVRASEQGSAEVDMVRWAKPERAGDACWISADSDPAVPIVYAEAELLAWMPLPTPLPRLRALRSPAGRHEDTPGVDDEIGGSGI